MPKVFSPETTLFYQINVENDLFGISTGEDAIASGCIHAGGRREETTLPFPFAVTARRAPAFLSQYYGAACSLDIAGELFTLEKQHQKYVLRSQN